MSKWTPQLRSYHERSEQTLATDTRTHKKTEIAQVQCVPLSGILGANANNDLIFSLMAEIEEDCSGQIGGTGILENPSPLTRAPLALNLT